MVYFNDREAYQNTRAYDRRFKLHPLMQNLLDNVLIFVKLKYNVPLQNIVTSTVSLPEEDLLLHRETNIHQEGRAFDISIRPFNEEQLNEIKVAFTQVAGHLGAIGHYSKLPTLIVDHDTGHGRHLHFQISKDAVRNYHQ
jgi:hypothetical protein